MGIETAIGFALIGYGLLTAGYYGVKGTEDYLRKERQATGAADIARGEEAKQKESDRKRLLGAEATPEQKARIRRKTRTILTRPLTGEEEFGTPPPALLGTGDVTKKATVG